VRDGDRLHALYDVCSHADVSLSEGEVDDGAVECWLHGSRFDLSTGQPSGLPATTPVPVYTATASEGDVFVALVPPARS
jgi:3-phenylpropionate/trans-cinnamate dioxygenase ferredoxin subunit